MIRRILIAEGILRLSALLLASLTACLVGLDTQTRKVFFIERKATVKDLSILWVLTIVASVTAGYNLIQLCKCLVSAWLAKDLRGFKKWGLWVCLMLDQGVMYSIFATTIAATQAAMVAATGVDRLQWTKLCNIYTRFCAQIGGGLLCALTTSLAMALLSPISAYNLVRLFSSSKLPH